MHLYLRGNDFHFELENVCRLFLPLEKIITHREETPDAVDGLVVECVSVEHTDRVDLSCRLADYVQNFPRFGVEFAVDKAYDRFAYVGYGPTESYCDKLAACDFGFYESTAEKNYDRGYVRPQESGSHYGCEYLSVEGLFSVTAEKPFSCSVNPFTTEQLRTAQHDFDLPQNDFVNVCMDLAMRGIGSASCGPLLPEEFEIPKTLHNTFRFTF